MRPGETVTIIRGEHQGYDARINKSDGYFFSVQLLTASGRKSAKGIVNVHRSALKEKASGM